MDISTRNRLRRELADAMTHLERNRKILITFPSDKIQDNITRFEELVEKIKNTINEGLIIDETVVVKEGKKKQPLIQSAFCHSGPKKFDRITREKDYVNSERHVEKATDKLPKFMEEKLKTMPNNEGYIFRDVIFLGRQPAKSEVITILDTSNRDEMLITTHYPEYTCIYSKKRDGPKKLISKKSRTQKIGSKLY